MKGVCLQYGCIKCCLNTEMPLTSSDIIRIRRLRVSNDFFIAKKNGNRHLKNLSGRCIFHNGQRCTIYNYRPEGCRLYPVIFCETTGETLLDSYCPHHEKFQLTSSASHEVIKLVRELDVEKKRRPWCLGKWQTVRHLSSSNRSLPCLISKSSFFLPHSQSTYVGVYVSGCLAPRRFRFCWAWTGR